LETSRNRKYFNFGLATSSIVLVFLWFVKL
jgi:hypothetical protein